MFFSEVTGQEETKQQLLSSLRAGRVSHAQLFAGDTGYGSLALALALAQYLLCTGEKGDDSCGCCLSCKHVAKLIHPDLHFVFPVLKKDTKPPLSDDYIGEWRKMVSRSPYFTLEDWCAEMGIEDKQPIIYEAESGSIVRKLSVKAFESDYKVMIVWLPEKMNKECSNKLLKIIEEPFDKTVFLLVSEQPEQIIITIQSRTQRVNIRPLLQDQIKQRLLAEQSVDEGKAEEYASVAAGSWSKALHLLNESEEQVYNQEQFVALMRLCWTRQMLPVNEWVTGVASVGRERQKSFLAHATHGIRENFMRNFGDEHLNYMTDREKAFAVKFSPYVHEGNVIQLADEFERAYSDIARNGNAKIVLTDLCIRVMQNIRPT
ncbi:DNA polymerase III subunit delta [Bacteroidia bacterium]|nr:DNA polymerase III subunit delta [Bacteroidia bacterium]